MTATIVFTFPGQSSRYPGMITKLAGLSERNRQLLAAASDYLDRDLASHYAKDNETAYARNMDVQIGVFLANQMLLQVLEEADLSADLSLGLSLGEYNHLVQIGALSLREALLTVEKRGQAYDAGPRGMMASVFPIELDELEEVIRRTEHLGVLEVVNLNSPRQHVLSGEAEPLQEAEGIIEEETYAQAVIIEKQVPMHCSTFEPVGVSFRAHLETVAFEKPRLPYLPNRLGRILEDPDRESFVDLLSTHVHKPVLWRKSIDHVVERAPDAVFVEVGPMSVLTNLLTKKWHKNRKLCTDSRDDTAGHLREVIHELKQLRKG